MYKRQTPVPEYTVSYDANGAEQGSAPVDAASPYAQGSKVTVLANIDLAKAGYTFAGWNTQADGKGTAYQAGDTFEIAANTVLYAQWNKLPAEEETETPKTGEASLVWSWAALAAAAAVTAVLLYRRSRSSR